MDQEPAEYGIGRLFWLTSDAIVGADLNDGVISLWNPAAERLFGYSASEAIGMPLEALVPEYLRSEHLAGIRRYRSGAPAVLVGTGPVEVAAATKRRTTRTVALTLTDLSAGADRSRVVALIRDVTAQRQAERDLAAANEAMREFMAAASHDLRTPLATIAGYADLLTNHGEELEAEEHEEGLAVIARSVRAASRLVADLLTLSQIHAGAISARASVVRVADAARRAMAVASVDATVEVDDALAVSVDGDHLERILVNYLTNAARYGVPPISVVATRDDERTVAVRVCDRGDGPPAEFVGRLFDNFTKATPSAGDGTGLGLSIVKGLAEANGGTAFYEHDPELGTCFGVTLPVGAP